MNLRGVEPFYEFLHLFLRVRISTNSHSLSAKRYVGSVGVSFDQWRQSHKCNLIISLRNFWINETWSESCPLYGHSNDTSLHSSVNLIEAEIGSTWRSEFHKRFIKFESGNRLCTVCISSNLVSFRIPEISSEIPECPPEVPSHYIVVLGPLCSYSIKVLFRPCEELSYISHFEKVSWRSQFVSILFLESFFLFWILEKVLSVNEDLCICFTGETIVVPAARWILPIVPQQVRIEIVQVNSKFFDPVV